MLTKKEKQEIIKKYSQSKGDTGSPKVQVALLSKRIARLTEHLDENTQDIHSKRGLVRMISRRRKLLRYIKDHEGEKEYDTIVKDLGIGSRKDKKKRKK